MRIRCFLCFVLLAFTLLPTPRGRAQLAPTTADITSEIAPNGSIDLTFRLTFDAKTWRPWRAVVGDDPARLRGVFQHQFAAYTIENFKLERDDVNRSAKLTMHSPTGPDLRSDGSFQVPVEPYFHLVNGSGREWFFSGNNPYAGNALNNAKIVLPPNAGSASLINAGTADQALAFALQAAPGASRWLLLAGGFAAFTGAALLAGGFLRKDRLGPPRPALPGSPPLIVEATTRVLPPPPPSFVSPPPPPITPPPPPVSSAPPRPRHDFVD